jgi:hypothetical protein
MDYAEKLKDPRWQKKRLKILERDNWTCKICFATDKTLHVHHLFYFRNKEPWEVHDGFLITVCEDCHESGGSCPTVQGLKSCQECPDFISKPDGDCEGVGGDPSEIGLLLDTIWKKGYGIDEDLINIAEAIFNAGERPKGMPLDCTFKAEIWKPKKKE